MKLKSVKSIGSTLNMLSDLIDLCEKKKVNQLVLPDGTCIIMNPLAFYADVLPQKLEKPIESTEFKLDNLPTLGEDMDEELLFASARG